MIHSTMSDFPLSINAIFRHGRHVHAASQCVTFTGDGAQRASYRQVADNADRLAAALKGLGVEPGDPVGTFMWNDQEHLEAYFAVPCMGAVLHTLNIRLSAEQLVYVVNHAGDRVVLVDTSLLPVIGAVASELSTVEAWIVVGDGDASALVATGRPVHRYHELLAASGWPRTGDVGTVTPNGYMQITDRAKDVIKSGGEWISSVELENALMAHPAVVEAAVIGIPDPRWDERPLACVVAAGDVDPGELKQFLAEHVAKWQVPENWAFVDEIPKTSVGKFDKKTLRARYEKGDLTPDRVG